MVLCWRSWNEGVNPGSGTCFLGRFRLCCLIFLKYLDQPVKNSAWEGHGGDGGASFGAALALPWPSFCPKSASQTTLLSVHSHQWALIVVPWCSGVKELCIASFYTPTNSNWFLPLYREGCLSSIPVWKQLSVSPTPPKVLSCYAWVQWLF